MRTKNIKLKMFFLASLASFIFGKAEAAENLSHITNAGGTVYFADDFEGGYQHLGLANVHAGGGYFSYMGGPVTRPEGTGCSSVAEYHNTVISQDVASQGAVAGSYHALKTPYDRDCPGESSTRDITVITIPPSDELYIRWYQKWTGEWNSGSVQQKFTKFNFNGDGGTNAMHFSFAPYSKVWRNFMPNVEGKFNKDGVTRNDWVWVCETPEAAGSVYEGVNRSYDDINNGLGEGATDRATEFETERWYCIELHFKINSDANTVDAVSEAWVDGNKTFEVNNFKFYPNSSRNEKFSVTNLELQHIYYDRTLSDQPTYMDNIVIADSYIGPVNTVSDVTAPSSPSGISIS